MNFRKIVFASQRMISAHSPPAELEHTAPERRVAPPTRTHVSRLKAGATPSGATAIRPEFAAAPAAPAPAESPDEGSGAD